MGLSLGSEVDCEAPARACLHFTGGTHAPLVGGPCELVQRDGAAQVQVRFVLPGEANPAECLHAVLAVQERSIERQRSRRRNREAVTVAGISGGPRGVPYSCACQFGARQHVGAAMLHTLELTDRATELHPHLRVLGCRLNTPLSNSDRLGREEYRSEIANPSRTKARQMLVGVAAHAVEIELRDTAAEVNARQLFGVYGRAVEHIPLLIELTHDHVGGVAAEHRPSAAQRDRARTCSRRQLRQPGRSPRTTGFVEHRGRERRREIRARSARASELLYHNRLFDQAVSGATVAFGDVQAEPARLTQCRPERRPRLSLRVDYRPHRARRDVRVDEPPDGLTQFLMLFGDADRHTRIVAEPSR